jgi:hypothetical protein
MSEKFTFKYNDGFKDVYGDPFEIDMRFQKSTELENMETIEKWISETPRDKEGMISESTDASQIKLFNMACSKLLPHLRAAFKLQPFNEETGEGLTADQVFGIQGDYNNWKDSLKKNT